MKRGLKRGSFNSMYTFLQTLNLGSYCNIMRVDQAMLGLLEQIKYDAFLDVWW